MIYMICFPSPNVFMNLKFTEYTSHFLKKIMDARII